MRFLKLLTAMFCIGQLVACSHQNCFDQELYNQHHNDVCTQDCPGVTGCDGNTYCNECIANSKGIHVRK